MEEATVIDGGIVGANGFCIVSTPTVFGDLETGKAAILGSPQRVAPDLPRLGRGGIIVGRRL